MQMKRKILLLVENLPVPFDRRVWMEATTLVEAGYQVSVICPKGTYPKYYEVLEKVRIYRYLLPSFESLLGHTLEYAVAFTLTALLTLLVFVKDGFDVIQSANPPDIFFVIGGFFKIFGKKFIFDHHDLMPEICDTRWSGWKHSVAHGLSAWAERCTFRTADRIISTNESYRQVAIRRGQVNPANIAVVRSGPCIASFQPVPANPIWKKGKPYLACYLGVMGANDGLEYLLSSIHAIVNERKRTDIQFILIGSGDLLPKLKNLCRSLNLDGFIEFTGRVPNEAVKEIISTADIAVAPDPKDALNDKSTMNKIIEYMALKKPIVSFDLHETRVSAGDAAVYAEPNCTDDFADRIIALLEQPEKRRSMAEYGRQRFEESLAWDHQQKIFLDLYESLYK